MNLNELQEGELQEVMKRRWIDFYKFKLKGSNHWQEWHENYHELQDDIENLFDVIEVCQVTNQYEDLKEIWQYLSDYAHIYGYWNHRVNWLEWLGSEAKKRGDWQVFVSTISKRAWTKILIGSDESLNDAEALLEEASKHCLYNEVEITPNRIEEVGVSLEIQYDVVENLAALLIRKAQYEKAQEQLMKANKIVELSKVKTNEQLRRLVTITYYKAEIAFRKKDYKTAKSLFQKVINESKIIRWYRARNYAQNWLADIAIKQGELEKADNIISNNQKVAEEQNDMRRIACFQASSARLSGARKQFDLAVEKAESALLTFKKLGMTVEILEMERLILIFKRNESLV